MSLLNKFKSQKLATSCCHKKHSSSAKTKISIYCRCGNHKKQLVKPLKATPQKTTSCCSKKSSESPHNSEDPEEPHASVQDHHHATTSCCATNKPSPKFDYFFSFLVLIVAWFYFSQLFFPDFVAQYHWYHTMAHAIFDMTNIMWWGVAIGALMMGIISKVPRQYIAAIMGQGGTKQGLLRAVGAGFVLDLCSHGILMVGVKLYQQGISLGQFFAFMISSPWNSFSLTIIMISLLGFWWTLLFILLSMVIALITGWIIDKLVVKGVLPANPNPLEVNPDFAIIANAKQDLKQVKWNFKLFKEIIIQGVVSSKIILRWLLIGLLMMGIMRLIFNPDSFANYFGASLLGLVTTVALATLIEVCSEGATPLAVDILERAGAPGNSFAFLMAGVATDYTAIAIIRDTTKSWKIALFLPLVSMPQILVIAYILNHLA